MSETVKSFKGFNKNMTCRDKQYEEGKSYTEECAKACDCGMHACEYPLDCFNYYAPGQSVYHEVEQNGQLDRNDDDTKLAPTEMKIGARLDIRGLVKAAIEFTKSRTTMEHKDPEKATAGYKGAATAGYKGAATAGYKGAATAGDSGAATAGYKGAATAGDSGAATAGNCGAATAGYKGAATAGNYGAATAGDSGAATAGNCGAATAGDCGAATSRGQSCTGDDGLSVARGNNVRVKGGLGTLLVIAEENLNNFHIKYWKVVVVDGENVKPNTWYCLNYEGNLIECKNEASDGK